MAGRIKVSFHTRVFIALLVLCWTLVGIFVFFQYRREKQFRNDLFDMELQMFNTRIIDDMSAGEAPEAILSRIKVPFPDIRLTVIDGKGAIVYDNKLGRPYPATNHNSRPEVAEARKNGSGYTVERLSQSNDEVYFYSATLNDDTNTVVRSAVPYSSPLVSFLGPDFRFLWIMALIAVLAGLGGYFVTRRISTSISRLNHFAEKAGRGEHIYDEWQFPHDELGNIAGNIVKLYVQRDQRHREAIEHEREKIRIKKQLTNNINHELKTPLASISVCAELINDHPELSDEDKQCFLARILDNVNRLESLLSDVSTITRMDDGAEMIATEAVDIREIVQSIAADERLRTDIEIKVNIPSIVRRVNPGLIESVFRNLFDNAIAYSGASCISVSADNEGHFVFRDNGSGIPDEHLEHIFERFYRIDKGRSRQHGGTGLGLAIVKNVIVIHGGTIRASNENGLRFDFSFPDRK